MSGRFDEPPLNESAREEVGSSRTNLNAKGSFSTPKKGKKLSAEDKVRRSRRKLKRRIVREFAQLDVDDKGCIIEEDLFSLWKKSGVDTSTEAVRVEIMYRFG